MYRCNYTSTTSKTCPWGHVCCEMSDEEHGMRKKSFTTCPEGEVTDHFVKCKEDEFLLLVLFDDPKKTGETLSLDKKKAEEALDKTLSAQFKEGRHVTILTDDDYIPETFLRYASQRGVEVHLTGCHAGMYGETTAEGKVSLAPGREDRSKRLFRFMNSHTDKKRGCLVFFSEDYLGKSPEHRGFFEETKKSLPGKLPYPVRVLAI